MGMEAFYRTLDPKKHHMTWSFNPNGLSHIESYYNLKSTSQMIHGTGCRETGRGGAEGGGPNGSAALWQSHGVYGHDMVVLMAHPLPQPLQEKM